MESIILGILKPPVQNPPWQTEGQTGPQSSTGFLHPKPGSAASPLCLCAAPLLSPQTTAGIQGRYWWPPPASSQEMVSSSQDGSTWEKTGQLLIHSSCWEVETDGRETKVQTHVTRCSSALPIPASASWEQPVATQPGEPDNSQDTLRAASQDRIRHTQLIPLDQGTASRGGNPGSQAQRLSVQPSGHSKSSLAFLSARSTPLEEL